MVLVGQGCSIISIYHDNSSPTYLGNPQRDENDNLSQYIVQSGRLKVVKGYMNYILPAANAIALSVFITSMFCF